MDKNKIQGGFFPKICHLCKESFPMTTEFWYRYNHSRTHNFQSTCKKCRIKQKAKYYIENQDKIKKQRIKMQ